MIRGGHAVLSVANVASSVRFYIETLGMKLVEETADSATLDAGDGFRFVLETGNTRGSLVFYAKLPLAEAIAIYANRGVSFDEAGRFHDPDGNQLQLR